MKFSKKIERFFVTFCLAMSIVPAQAHAGDKEGNGGGGYACINRNGTFRWIDLLDFHEAREGLKNGIDIPSEAPLANEISDEELKEIALQQLEPLRERMKAISPTFLYRFDRELKTIFEIEDRTTYSALTVTKDFNTRFVPDEGTCKNGKIAYVVFANYGKYAGKTSLVYAKKVYQEFKRRPKLYAATLVHEALYAVFRKYGGDTDSDRARALNAHLHSNLEPHSYALLFLPEAISLEALRKNGVPDCVVFVVPPQERFKMIRPYSEGLAAVAVHDGPLVYPGWPNGSHPLWGYIDQEGRMVIPPQWFDAREFHYGLAAVQSPWVPGGSCGRGFWQYIDVVGTPRITKVLAKYGWYSFAEVGDFNSQGVAWTRAQYTEDGCEYDVLQGKVLRHDSTFQQASSADLSSLRTQQLAVESSDLVARDFGRRLGWGVVPRENSETCLKNFRPKAR